MYSQLKTIVMKGFKLYAYISIIFILSMWVILMGMKLMGMSTQVGDHPVIDVIALISVVNVFVCAFIILYRVMHTLF